MCILMLASPGCKKQSGTQTGSSTANSPSGEPWFEEIAQERGLTFRHESPVSDRYLLPETIPGGAALLDIDNDGDLDVYFIQSGQVLGAVDEQPANQLFENLGDATFRNITEKSGLGDRGYGMGVACGDYDNDGDVDVYITNLGANVLYQNQGDGTFVDVTNYAGVGHEGWGTSAAFLDYDRDGDLDLFVCNYVKWSLQVEIECYNAQGARDYCSPGNYDLPSADVLYRNNGDGTFTDVSDESGVALAFGNGLGVVGSDFNNDGWIDIFVANDTNPDHLWINQKDGTFLERGLFSGCAVDQEGIAKAGMGVTVGDIDFDGDFDLMVGNLAKESDSLFLNDNGFFTDGTIRYGLSSISRRFTRFGIGWSDFDNDGRLDLFQATGRVVRQETAYGTDPYAEPNLLFQGMGNSRFEERLPRGGIDTPTARNSRAVVFGDIDNDGGIDLLIINQMNQVHLLRNIAPQRGNWLSLRILDENQRDAYGAIVSMTIGEKTIRKEVRAAYSYLSSNDPRVHIGLGKEERVTNVTVIWPDGTGSEFGEIQANQFRTLNRLDSRESAD